MDTPRDKRLLVSLLRFVRHFIPGTGTFFAFITGAFHTSAKIAFTVGGSLLALRLQNVFL
jgi:hypothetical protein